MRRRCRAPLTVSAKNAVAQSDGQNNLDFYRQKAVEYYEKEQDDSARFYYGKALEISEKAKDTATMVQLYLATLEVLDATDARLNRLDKAMKPSEQIKDTASLANCYRIIGALMENLGYDQTAEEPTRNSWAAVCETFCLKYTIARWPSKKRF